MTPRAEQIVLPPPEAFLIHPHFASSDLWVWPLFLVLAGSWFKMTYSSAGLDGRGINLLAAVRATNSMVLWWTIIALSRAVHRATDDVIVSGVWTGAVVLLSGGLYTLIMRRTPLRDIEQQAKAAIARFGEQERAKAKARQEAKARGEVPRDEHGRPVVDYIQPDGPAAAKRHVAVLMRPDLFAEPETPTPSIILPPHEPEKPPQA